MRVVLIVLATASLTGCLDPSPSESTTTSNLTTKNRLSTNRLATNRLATNRLATNRLATNRLATNRLSANALTTTDLLSTVDGRNVYSYFVGCAVPAGMTIEADVPNAPDTTDPDDEALCTAGHCVFQGSLGLAPNWIDHTPTAADERYVSACLFARCNAHDTAEPISMRGPTPALDLSPGEATDFPLQEAAFYGNFFDDTDQGSGDGNNGNGHGNGHGRGHDHDFHFGHGFGFGFGHDHDNRGHDRFDWGNWWNHYGNHHQPPPPPTTTEIQWYACEGQDKAANPDEGELTDRDCAEPTTTSTCALAGTTCAVDSDCPTGDSCNLAGTHTQCGFIYAGACANYHPVFSTPYACDNFNVTGTYYTGCHHESADGVWPDPGFHEVITTYVTDTP